MHSQTLLSREKIISLGNKLAPTAATFGRLRLLLQDPQTGLDEIVQLVRLDAALSFHVVRMSNSVLFGPSVRDKTDSLEVGVSRVGLKEIFRLIALAATQQVCQQDLVAYRLPSARLWENAIATAAAAEVLANRSNRDAGLAYSAGLMRTLGRVILDGAANGLVYPGEAEWPSVSEWETATFGITSAEVTTMLLEHWHFPSEMTESIRGHYNPLADPESSNIGACVLNLACGVAARFGLDLPGEAGDWACSPAKLTMAGVAEADIEECAARAKAHYVLLCASVA